MSWLRTSQELSDKFSRNAHDVFELEDSEVFPDPVTRENDTAGSLLTEITRQLRLHKSEPFTYQRLVELADLDESVRAQYEPPTHGAAYLRAVLLLSRVTSSSDAFADFDEHMSHQLPDGIRLEPIEWASLDEFPTDGGSEYDIPEDRYSDSQDADEPDAEQDTEQDAEQDAESDTESGEPAEPNTESASKRRAESDAEIPDPDSNTAVSAAVSAARPEPEVHSGSDSEPPGSEAPRLPGSEGTANTEMDSTNSHEADDNAQGDGEQARSE